MAGSGADGGGEGSAAELLTDFTDADHNAGWRVVNDNVMGGRSIGELSFQTPEGAGMSAGAGEGSMTFEGYINTNGGGFASVRLPLPDETLVGVTAIRLTLQAAAQQMKATRVHVVHRSFSPLLPCESLKAIWLPTLAHLAGSKNNAARRGKIYES